MSSKAGSLREKNCGIFWDFYFIGRVYEIKRKNYDQRSNPGWFSELSRFCTLCWPFAYRISLWATAIEFCHRFIEQVFWADNPLLLANSKKSYVLFPTEPVSRNRPAARVQDREESKSYGTDPLCGFRFLYHLLNQDPFGIRFRVSWPGARVPSGSVVLVEAHETFRHRDSSSHESIDSRIQLKTLFCWSKAFLRKNLAKQKDE